MNKHKICEDFLRSFDPKITLTRSGLPAIICTNHSGDEFYPLIGVYYNYDSWIPCRWARDGKFHNNSQKTGLDLLINEHEPEAA
jgi:hypothetical protein